MKLTDKCWTLNRTEGISERTVSDATRGDCEVSEFYVTEADAWDAEADRARGCLDRAQRDVERQQSRMFDAQRRARELREAKP